MIFLVGIRVMRQKRFMDGVVSFTGTLAKKCMNSRNCKQKLSLSNLLVKGNCTMVAAFSKVEIRPIFY